MGPYPPNLAEFCPPELDPDPSKPVYVIDPKTGLSEAPVAWRHAATQSTNGLVQLGEQFGQSGNRSVYALNYAFSPNERTATLWLSENMRVWVNGELLGEPTSPGAWHWAASKRFPIVLRAGRNTILLKKGPGDHLVARLGDNPYDRGLEFYRFGLFAEAAEAFAAAHRCAADDARRIASAYLGRFYAVSQLVEGNLDEYRRSARELADRRDNSTSYEDLANVVCVCSYGPDGLDLQRLAKALEAWKKDPLWEKEPWQKVPAALAEYRLGRFQEVIRQLEPITGNPFASVVLAMAHHRLGHAEQAGNYLEKSRGPVESSFENADRPTVDYIEWGYIVYREACRLIRGNSTDIDARYARFRETRRKLWQDREPALADYIDAVRAAADQPPVHVARGRRLAELKRFEAAEAIG